MSEIIPEIVVKSANVCQLAVSVIALSAYLPQWIKLLQTKSSDDISLRSWILWMFSTSLAIYYAIVQFLMNGRGWPLIISSLIGFGSILFTIFLIVRYRSKKQATVRRVTRKNLFSRDSVPMATKRRTTGQTLNCDSANRFKKH